jgi:hypothetical protein
VSLAPGSLAGRLILNCRGHRHWHGPTDSEVGSCQLPPPARGPTESRAGPGGLTWHGPILRATCGRLPLLREFMIPGSCRNAGVVSWLRARANTKPTGRGKQLPELACASGGPPASSLRWSHHETKKSWLHGWCWACRETIVTRYGQFYVFGLPAACPVPSAVALSDTGNVTARCGRGRCCEAVVDDGSAKGTRTRASVHAVRRC